MMARQLMFKEVVVVGWGNMKQLTKLCRKKCLALNIKAGGAYSSDCKAYWILETCYNCQTGAPEVFAKCHRNLKLVGAARNILEILHECFSCQQYTGTVSSILELSAAYWNCQQFDKCSKMASSFRSM